MYKNLFASVFALCLINAQGLKGIKDKIKEVEKEIRDNAALIEVITPENFKGERQDLVKEFTLKRKREEVTILGVQGFTDSDTWVKFGSIGNNVDVINMRMGKYKNRVKSESSFGKRVASREYQFQVSVDGEITSCDCVTKTTRKSFLGFLFPKFKNELNCVITNSLKNVSTLTMVYAEYKSKIDFKKKLASAFLPENWRDDGRRTSLSGRLTSGDLDYTVSSTYDYDITFLNDKSPFSLIKPPLGYYVSSGTDQTYYMVKDPSKFRISNTLNDKVKAGEFYCSIAAAYFYMPLEYAMNPEEKTTTNTVGLPASVGKVEIDGEPSSKHFERNKDYFLLARHRGALGLF